VINLDRAREWLGRVDVQADQAAPAPLAALFDLMALAEPAPNVGAELPALAHWLYFRAWGRQSEISENGEYLDPFLPPIELPRREWAESHIVFHRALRVGDTISRSTHLVDIGHRNGQAGEIVTLLIRHEIGDAQGVAISEDRRLVYTTRDEPWPIDEPRRTRGAAMWSRQFRPDTRALFRYSALTLDASRVHYDRPFATFVEGRPGLVVQSGLIAALLFQLLRAHAPHRKARRGKFRIRRRLFDTEAIALHGRLAEANTAELWAEDSKGRLAMEVVADLADNETFAAADEATLSCHRSVPPTTDHADR
jgi:3-methylfumaryl-CoA hydratase